MTNFKKTTPADNETVLAHKLAMAEAVLGELQSHVMAIQDLAGMAIEGDETGALTVAVMHLAGHAGACIDQYEKETGEAPFKGDLPEWLFYPQYRDSRDEYRKAVAHAGGAA